MSRRSVKGDANTGEMPPLGGIVDLGRLPTIPETAKGPRLKILLLADTEHPANCVRDYYEGIRLNSSHDITLFNPVNKKGKYIPSLVSYDAVIIHYSVCIISLSHVSRRLSRKIRSFNGIKIQIIQDEYRWIDQVVKKINELGVDILVSSLEPHNIEKIYDVAALSGTTKCSALPGYVPDALLSYPAPPIADRPSHVVYRGRDNLQYWVGQFSREKVDIAKGFLQAAQGQGLTTDIETSFSGRLYGEDWNKFLVSGKAVLATEGGASIFDFDGRVEAEVVEFLSANPDADFDRVADQVLRPYEGNIVHKTITPRCLEAIALRTALVLFPGRYRGILEPWRHYIPLEPDFSNAPEVIKFLKDAVFLQDLVDRTYEEIAVPESLHMSTFVARLDGVIGCVALARRGNWAIVSKTRRLLARMFARRLKRNMERADPSV